MKTSVKRNYILNLSYQLLSLLTPLITTPYVSRVLGVDQIGFYSYAGSIVAYFVLFAALGTSIYGQREISYCQSDKNRRSIVFWNIEFITLISSLVCLLVYIVYIGVSARNTGILFTILAFNIVHVVFDITWLYQGMEDFPIIVTRNVAARILNLLCIFIFINSRDDLIKYAIINIAIILFGSGALWLGIGKYVSKVSIKNIKIMRYLPGMLLLFVPNIATTLYTQLDKTMLGVLSASSVENGYYEQAMKISKMSLTLVTSLGTVMLPRIGVYYNAGNSEQIKKTLYKSFCFVTFLGCPLSLGLIGISANFVPWFFGKGYDGVIGVLRILSFHNIIIAYSNVAGIQFLVPTGQQNKLTLSVFAGAIVNFVLNFLFIPKWFAVGAAVASVISEMAVTAVQMYFIGKVIKSVEIFRGTWKYMLCAAVMLLVVLLEDIWLRPSLVNTIFMIGSGAAVYIILLLLMKDRLLIETLTQAEQKVRRNL